MKNDEISYTNKKYLFSPQLTQKSKNFLGLPKLGNKKKLKIEDTLSFNFSQSNYNTTHNKTISNRLLNYDKKNFFNNNYSTKISFSVSNLNDINILPKYFFNNVKIPRLRNFHNKIMNNNERSVKCTIKKRENEKEKEKNAKIDLLNNYKEIKKINNALDNKIYTIKYYDYFLFYYLYYQIFLLILK